VDILVIAPEFDEPAGRARTMSCGLASKDGQPNRAVRRGERQWREDAVSVIIEMARREGWKFLPSLTTLPSLPLAPVVHAPSCASRSPIVGFPLSVVSLNFSCFPPAPIRCLLPIAACSLFPSSAIRPRSKILE